MGDSFIILVNNYNQLMYLIVRDHERITILYSLLIN